MKIADAYKNLTEEAKTEAISGVMALLAARGNPVSEEYVYQTLSGIRKKPCGDVVARVISGYFRGIHGLDVSPEEVRGAELEPVAEPEAGMAHVGG